MSPRDIEALVADILSKCGMGPMLHLGCGDGKLVEALLSRGIDARGCDDDQDSIWVGNNRIPDRLDKGPLTALPYPDASFPAVLITNYERVNAGNVLAEVRRVATNCVYIVGSNGFVSDSAAVSICRSMFRAGFRRSPVASRALPTTPMALRTFVFELDPAPANEGPLSMSAREGEDWLGRYLLIAQFIRPYNVVCVAGCRTGAGSYVVRRNSPASSVTGYDTDGERLSRARDCFGTTPDLEFQAIEDGLLPELPDNTADVIVCALDRHPITPDTVSAWAKILRPGGRLILTGEGPAGATSFGDPETLGERGFLIEECRVFSAEKRAWVASSVTDLATLKSKRRQGYVLSLMRDPLDGASVPYVETSYPYTTPPPHLLQFEKEYRNPWLLRSMVEFHFRSDSSALLKEVATRVLERDEGSGAPDEAAALAVLGYQMLGSRADAEEVGECIQRISDYLTHAPETPHGLRWRISLQFLQALLFRRIGRLDEALDLFEEVLKTDPTPFSPTLGTKTVEAGFQAGMMALARGDMARARANWTEGITSAEKLLKTDWTEFLGNIDNPLPFPLVVAGEFLDSATKCLRALISTHPHNSRPQHRLFTDASACLQQYVKDRERWVAERDQWIADREVWIKQRDAKIARLQELTQLEEHWITERDEALARMQQWIDDRDGWIAERDDTIRKQKEWVDDRDRWLAERDEIIRRQKQWLEDRDRWLAERDDVIGRQKQWIEDRDRWIAERDETILKQKGWIDDRDRWIQERNDIIAAAHGKIADLDRVLTERNQWVADRDRWISDRDAWISERDHIISELRAELARRDETIVALKRTFGNRLASAIKRIIRR